MKIRIRVGKYLIVADDLKDVKSALDVLHHPLPPAYEEKPFSILLHKIKAGMGSEKHTSCLYH